MQQGTRSHEHGARGHPLPKRGSGMLCTAPGLRATDRGGLTHRRQQQRGARGAAAGAGTSSATGSAWGKEKKAVPVGQQPPSPPQHSSGWEPEGKQSPAGLRHKAPTRRVPGSAGSPHPGVPPPRSPGEGDAAQAGIRASEAVPGSRQPREQPRHEPNCRESSRASGGGPGRDIPLRPPGCSHRGIKSLHRTQHVGRGDAG